MRILLFLQRTWPRFRFQRVFSEAWCSAKSISWRAAHLSSLNRPSRRKFEQNSTEWRRRRSLNWEISARAGRNSPNSLHAPLEGFCAELVRSRAWKAEKNFGRRGRIPLLRLINQLFTYYVCHSKRGGKKDWKSPATVKSAPRIRWKGFEAPTR